MIVRSQVLKLPAPFITEKGATINGPVAAYEEYGNPSGPTIFITHGGLSSHHAAGRHSPEDEIPGFWDDIIGPAKAMDTNRYRVISANALGSMYGSSSPLTINPDTGKHYGPEFPEITLIDMVRFYKAFLNQMGVSELFMMAGPSMGWLPTPPESTTHSRWRRFILNLWDRWLPSRRQDECRRTGCAFIIL